MSAHGKRFEDYLKVVYMLQRDKEEVRLKEVARTMNLKPPTVLQYINKLCEMGLVVYSQGRIRLTEEGLKKAKKLLEKYEVIRNFFKDVMGMDEEKANEIACLIEHVVDEDTIEKMKTFMSKVKECM